MQVVRAFLKSHGFDASDVGPDDVSDDIGSTGIWEYDIDSTDEGSYEEIHCSIKPID